MKCWFGGNKSNFAEFGFNLHWGGVSCSMLGPEVQGHKWNHLSLRPQERPKSQKPFENMHSAEKYRPCVWYDIWQGLFMHLDISGAGSTFGQQLTLNGDELQALWHNTLEKALHISKIQVGSSRTSNLNLFSSCRIESVVGAKPTLVVFYFPGLSEHQSRVFGPSESGWTGPSEQGKL